MVVRIGKEELERAFGGFVCAFAMSLRASPRRHLSLLVFTFFCIGKFFQIQALLRCALL